MIVALPSDKDGNLVPLDVAEEIYLIDDEKKEIAKEKNEGYGSKEATMAMILEKGADVIGIKKGFLCPGSYFMSQGHIKYAVIGSDNVADVIKNKEYKNAKEELEEELFAENE
ncbi:MAG: hypothetical protein QXL16_02310 [Candidatus Micrarchaeaceae archaeon]